MTTKPKEVTPIRMALRQEGDWWVAYIASTENMVNPLEVARINLRFVTSVVDGTDRWTKLMSDGLSAMLTDLGHPPIRVDIRQAPESERSGNA